MAIGKYSIARFTSAIQTSKLPPQDQQNPVYNNNPNSSADNNYPYNPPKQMAQEPIVTSNDGTTSSKPEPAEQNYGSGVLKLQAKRANLSLQHDVQQPQTLPNPDTSGNLSISKQQNNMQDANYKEMIPYLQKQANKDFNRMALYSGLSNLGSAISGSNTRYQEYWSGGLVK